MTTTTTRTGGHEALPAASTEGSGEDNTINMSAQANDISNGTNCFTRQVSLDELAKQDEDEEEEVKKPAALVSWRYYIMLVALINPFVVSFSKTIINFALIDMIHPDFIGGTMRDESSSAAAITIPVNETIKNSSPSYFDVDQSCPVADQLDRARLEQDLSKDQRRAHERPGEKFRWDTLRQGLLKAAYYMGHASSSILGARLSERFGSRWVMCVSAVLIGLCCLVAPWMAAAHFYLMFADLLLLGSLGAFMPPATITLVSNWLTPSEKSLMVSLFLISSRLGNALSSLLFGLLIEAQLSWRYLFYSAGWVSFIFCALFFLVATSKPEQHPFIKPQELAYLASKNTLVREGLARKKPHLEMNEITANSRGSNMSRPGKSRSAPWWAILTNVPVWAFVVTKFCVKLASDTVQIELPTYLNRVMHFSAKANGIINSSNHIIFCVGCLLVSGLANVANKRRPFGCSKTALRKLFQCIASFGVAILMLAMAFSVCNNTLTEIVLMLMYSVATFATAGVPQIPLDISERYSATIHSIGSSLAVSGAVEPILVGYLLRGHPADKDHWAAVWMGVSGVAALGGLIFLLFGEATIQPFDQIDHQQEDHTKQNGAHDNKTFVVDVDVDVDRGTLGTPEEASSG